jgi:maltooligosyltrehalose trehalohydrolase
MCPAATGGERAAKVAPFVVRTRVAAGCPIPSFKQCRAVSTYSSYQFGPEPAADGTRFRIWAPAARRVDLTVDSGTGERMLGELKPTANGWFETLARGVRAGAKYRFRIDDEVDVPDPASRFHPDGVGGLGEIVDPDAFAWPNSTWRGREWHEAVIYELHIGTFTREGTYAAAISRLDDLARTGITAIELLPLNTFAGRRGWGYDGVLLYAPHAAYGRPEDLKRFVHAAHERNLMVLIDVVYNHFGPEGNYLQRYAPEFFTSAHHTPWGSAINFAHPVVRQFFIQNALYWLTEFRFDGLRVDAVHAMFDDGDTHFIDELVDSVQRGPGSDRHVHVVLENHHNEARRLGRRGKVIVSQWNDDFHHPMHILLSGESDGYYRDYADAPVKHLARVLAEGFAFQGEVYAFDGKPRGENSRTLPPTAFVNFLQNHDQIGNRAFGDRLAGLSTPEKLRAGLAILLLSPQVPMLFMGEEYAATQPFLYFCDYQGELAAAVREGRRSEFASFGAFADEQQRERIPDPNSPQTYVASQLDAQDRERSPHDEWLAYTRELLRIRGEKVVPVIPAIVAGCGAFEIDGQALTVSWTTVGKGKLVLQANMSDAPKQLAQALAGEVLFSTHAVAAGGQELGGWEVRLLSVAP